MFPNTDKADGVAGVRAGAGSELVSQASSPPKLSPHDEEGAACLEDVFAGGDPEKHFRCVDRPFSLSNRNPELLPAVKSPAKTAGQETPATVIFEKDGIPYIDNDACNRDKNIKEKLDGGFAELVDAVVHNRDLP